MATFDDGGAAFPWPAAVATEEMGTAWSGNPGMSLRDYVATATLTGLLEAPMSDADGPVPILCFGRNGRGLGWNVAGVPERLAALAYAMADAMLAERAKRPE